MILTVIFEGISKAAAVLSVLMELCTIPCHDRVYFNVVLVLQSCYSASFEVWEQIETPCTTHGLISICTQYHFKSVRSIFTEFHAELDVFSRFQFHIRAEIAIVVTNTRVVQLPLFTQ